LAGVLVWLGHHRRIRPGGLVALYVAGYSGFRIFEELLRVDPAHHILGLRLNLYVASVLFLAAVLAFTRIQSGEWPWRSVRRGATVVLVGAAIALTGCGDSGRAAAAPSHSKRDQMTGWNPIPARIAPSPNATFDPLGELPISAEGYGAKQIMNASASKPVLLIAHCESAMGVSHGSRVSSLPSVGRRGPVFTDLSESSSVGGELRVRQDPERLHRAAARAQVGGNPQEPGPFLPWQTSR
jgi:hypothetical protein